MKKATKVSKKLKNVKNSKKFGVIAASCGLVALVLLVVFVNQSSLSDLASKDTAVLNSMTGIKNDKNITCKFDTITSPIMTTQNAFDYFTAVLTCESDYGFSNRYNFSTSSVGDTAIFSKVYADSYTEDSYSTTRVKYYIHFKFKKGLNGDYRTGYDRVYIKKGVFTNSYGNENPKTKSNEFKLLGNY